MTIALKWKKGLFSDTSTIYSGYNAVGKLKCESFNNLATAELNDKHFRFKSKSFLGGDIVVFDQSTNERVGEITFNTFSTKAKIYTDSGLVLWRSLDIWGKRWVVFNDKGEKIKYSSEMTEGNLISDFDDELLILIGLYIPSFLSRITITIVTITMVIIIATISS
ncbi:hypothetical protein EMN47_19505 [Prolixibacteraceae bacterium JC049]|nr:hypothetical protein [Prolixibacteraceae bacterium JC049]